MYFDSDNEALNAYFKTPAPPTTIVCKYLSEVFETRFYCLSLYLRLFY